MTQENKEHEPPLLSEDHKEPKAKPPYLLVILVLFGVLGAFWKMAMHKNEVLEPAKQSTKAFPN